MTNKLDYRRVKTFTIPNVSGLWIAAVDFSIAGQMRVATGPVSSVDMRL